MLNSIPVHKKEAESTAEYRHHGTERKIIHHIGVKLLKTIVLESQQPDLV